MRVFALAIIAAAPIVGEAETHYVNVYNSAPSSIVAFEEAPAGTERFRAIELAARPVQGGGDSATIAFRVEDGGCIRDFRTTFADGRVLRVNRYDVCRMPVYRTGPLLTRSIRNARATDASRAAEAVFSRDSADQR